MTHPRRAAVAPLAAAITATMVGHTSAAPVAAPLEHVLVTVPIHRKAAETTLPVTVMTADELRRQAGTNIGSVLSKQPGIANSSFGPGVGQPVVRGQSGPRVKVLQNGMVSGDVSVTSADHAITVEPLLADSVEVLRGPATLLYGGGAIGGVVNVIDGRIPSRVPSEPVSGAVEYRHDTGSDGDSGVFRLDGGSETLAWHLSGVSREWNNVEIPGLAFDRSAVEDLEESSDGYIANTAGRNLTVTGGLSWLFERGFVGVAVSDTESRYGIPRGGHAAAQEVEAAHGEDEEHEAHDQPAEDASHGDTGIDLRQTRVDLKGEWHAHTAWVDVLRGQLSHTDYEHAEIESNGVIATLFENETWEGRLELVHPQLGDWHGVVGLQWRHTDFVASGEESFIPPTETEALGLFWLEDYHRGDWTYEFGIRLDHDRIKVREARDRSFTAASGSASALWNFAPAWQAGLALSVAERAPTVEELYSNHGNAGWHEDHYDFHDPVVHAATRSVELGDETLSEEQSRNADLTLRYAAAGIDAHLTAFYNQFHDFIYLDYTGATIEGVAVRAYRQADARFRGVELEVTMPVLVGADGSSLALTVYGDHVRGRLAAGGDLPRLPAWRAGSRLVFERGALHAYADLQHAADQERPGRGESETDSWQRLDLGVSYEVPVADASATLFLHARNVNDEEIRLSTSVLREFAPEPGRSLEAGIRLLF